MHDLPDDGSDQGIPADRAAVSGEGSGVAGFPAWTVGLLGPTLAEWLVADGAALLTCGVACCRLNRCDIEPGCRPVGRTMRPSHDAGQALRSLARRKRA